MTIELQSEVLEQSLETAYVLASSNDPLPQLWLERAESLAHCPSDAAISAYGAVLLAKSAYPSIDPFVVQSQEGSEGAFSLRSAASVLARNKRTYGYDIGSQSDRDPINAKTWINARRWDDVLKRVRKDHKPFVQVIINWLPSIDKLTPAESRQALAAYIRARSKAGKNNLISPALTDGEIQLGLTELIDALDAFLSANPEGGATGMALVAAVFRASRFEVILPSKNDPRRLDVHIKLAGKLFIGCEVKQVETHEGTAIALGEDVVHAQVERGLLAVLPPGTLGDLNRTSVIQRVEQSDGVIVRITNGVRELVHEAIASSDGSIPAFVQQVPLVFAEALVEINASVSAIETWTTLSLRWTEASD